MGAVPVPGVVETHRATAPPAAGTGTRGAGLVDGGGRRGTDGGDAGAGEREVAVGLLGQGADLQVILVHDVGADLRWKLPDEQLLEEDAGVGLLGTGQELEHLGEELGRPLVPEAGEVQEDVGALCRGEGELAEEPGLDGGVPVGRGPAGRWRR